MKGTILLSYNENTKQIEDEEKTRFLHSFLEQCFESVPDVISQIQTIGNSNGILSASQKVKVRGVLATYGIQVIDDFDGHMQIYLDSELVAEWFKCTYKLKKDLREIDPRKRLYLEMAVNYWTIFEKQEEEQQETE